MQEITNHTLYCCCHLVAKSVSNSFAVPWTVACQAPLSIEFSRQEYWNGLPCPSPGNLLEPGIEPASLMSPALTGRFFTTGAIWEGSAKRCAPQLLSLCSRAREPQLLSLRVLEPVLCWLQRHHCKRSPRLP